MKNRLVSTGVLVSTFSMLTLGTSAAASLDAAASPLRINDEQLRAGTLAAVPLEFDADAYADLKGRKTVTIEAFPLAPSRRGEAHRHVELELTRVNTINENTQFVAASYVNGEVTEEPIDLPEVEMFRGHVVDEAGSYVFLSFSPEGTHGYIRSEGVTQLISPGPHGENKTPLIYNLDAIPAGSIQWRDFICNAQTQAPQPGPDEPIVAGGAASGSDAPCRRVDVAIETDYEFTANLFGGSTVPASIYMSTLMGASSEIFTRDVGVEFNVVYVRLWTTPDPWDQNTTADQLFQFRDYWNANMSHITRHLAHFISGRNLGGGVAWLNAVCHPTQGYALSANMNGSFPYPMEDNNSQNWDIMVVTHEFGHNFGTPHTHDYCPPLDECWSGQCSSGNGCINNGTIMGYCHTCPGGMTNVVLEFHPTVRQTMLDYLDTVNNCYLGCVPQSSVVNVPEDTESIQEAVTVVLPGGEINVGPGVYSETINTGGKAVHIRSTDGPEATIINGSGGSAFRFTNGESSETVIEGFTLTGGTGSNVTIGGTSYVVGGGIYAASSAPTIIDCIISGNSAQFGGGVFLNNASPIFENCVIENNSANPSSGGGVFSFTGGSPQFINTQFIGNTAAANGGAVSSQGAAPVFTDCLFRDNEAAGDGGAIRNIQGSNASFNNCRFESNTAGGTGGAFINDDSPSNTIADSLFCENAPNAITGSFTDAGGNTFDDLCSLFGDLNGDGTVGIADLLILLGVWGECDGCAADLNGDGVVDVADMLILLGEWG